MGILKSHSELRSFREAGRIASVVLKTLMENTRPGISTPALETLANQILREHRSTAPFKNFDGFNHAICISINEEIVNGPPSRERHLKAGDLVSVATAAEHRGIHAKAARTWYVGSSPDDPPPPDMRRLMEGTAQTIARAIERSRSISTLNELLGVIPETAKIHGLTVIRGLGGMGIGKKLHEAPAVPNDPALLTDPVPLAHGLAFTLMPMFSLGSDEAFDEHEDGWTYLTRDRAPAAHVADTLLMTENGLIRITGPDE